MSPCQTVPIKVLDNVATVKLGGSYTAALQTDGSLWTWGDNQSCQLGNGDTETAYTPVKVLDGVAAVECYVDPGAGYSMRTFAIKTDKTLWAWGSGTLGLGKKDGDGNGDNYDRQSTDIPVKILDHVAAVDPEHCAAAKTDGTLWKWGGYSYPSNLWDVLCGDADEYAAAPVKVEYGFMFRLLWGHMAPFLGALSIILIVVIVFVIIATVKRRRAKNPEKYEKIKREKAERKAAAAAKVETNKRISEALNRPIRCSCGTSNPATAKFCSTCGKPVVVPGRCPACGHQNDPAAKFCQGCGKPLGREETHLKILFCDEFASLVNLIEDKKEREAAQRKLSLLLMLSRSRDRKSVV